MSRQVRYRVAAGVLGGLLLGMPLLTSGSANAGQAGSCADHISQPALATAPAAEPGDHRLGDHRPHRGHAARAPSSPTPEPITAPSVAPSRGSAVPAAGTPPSTGIEAPTSQVKRPQGQAAKAKSKIIRGTGRSAPMVAGPSRAQKANLHGVPIRDLPSLAGSASAAPARPGPDIAAEQVASTEPIPEQGLIGLLAAVSMVLVLGVSAGVIRAIVSERASPTKIA